MLRSTLLGLPRVALTDSTDAEWDVAAQFNDPAVATSATVYIFHAAVPSVAIWFDRAAFALLHRQSFGGAAPASPVTSFAVPGSAVPGGLRRVFRPTRGPYKSSGLAVMPVGEWMVAVRLSSTEFDPAALDARLAALVTEIGWPAPSTPATGSPAPGIATVVAPCTDRIDFHQAKLRKPDLSQALLGSLLAANSAKTTSVSGGTTPWCREGDGRDNYGIYRKAGATNSYMLALGDAGRSADVFPGLALSGMPATGGYTVTLADVDGSVVTYPSFDALPKPEQVLDLIARRRPVSRTATNGKNLNITLDSKLVD